LNRRLVELAFVLPFLGAFLLTPPAVVIVQSWGRAAGFPLFIVYVFVCWAALIAAGAAISVRLGRMDDAAAGRTRRGEAKEQ
jgi:hypothetical protein